MGFSTVIDLIGSIVIGGLLFLILMRMNDTATKNTYAYSNDYIVQSNLTSIVEVLEHDFRKIGYCADNEKIPDPTLSIVSADTSSITFKTDVVRWEGDKGDGVVDQVKYYLGSLEELSSTPNPRDRMLYRIVNNEDPKGANLGVTYFRIKYFNALGDSIPYPITDPGEIWTMQINVRIENIQAYDNEYRNIYWKQIRLAARNIRNR